MPWLTKYINPMLESAAWISCVVCRHSQKPYCPKINTTEDKSRMFNFSQPGKRRGDSPRISWWQMGPTALIHETNHSCIFG